MKIYNNPPKETWNELIQRPQLELGFLESAVRNIINRVKKSGDHALRELTYQYDKVRIQQLQANADEIRLAEKMLPEDLKNAIRIAASNIEKFHAVQKKETPVVS